MFQEITYMYCQAEVRDKVKVYFENSSVKQILKCKVSVTSVAEVPILKLDM